MNGYKDSCRGVWNLIDLHSVNAAITKATQNADSDIGARREQELSVCILHRGSQTHGSGEVFSVGREELHEVQLAWGVLQGTRTSRRPRE